MKRSYYREHVKEAHCHTTQMTAHADIKKRVTRFRYLGLLQSDLEFRHKKKKTCIVLHSSTPPHPNTVYLPSCFYYFSYYFKFFEIIT